MRVRRVFVPYIEMAYERVPGTVELAALKQAGFDLDRPYEVYESPAHNAVEFVQEVPDAG